MKTLAITILLCTAAICAAILAPSATSGTTEMTRIAELEQRVDQLFTQADCMRTGMPVTIYKAGPNSKPYLAPTRSEAHRRYWIVVMTPGCVPRHPTPHELSWSR